MRMLPVHLHFQSLCITYPYAPYSAFLPRNMIHAHMPSCTCRDTYAFMHMPSCAYIHALVHMHSCTCLDIHVFVHMHSCPCLVCDYKHIGTHDPALQTLFRVTRNMDMPEATKLEFLKIIGMYHMRILDGLDSLVQLSGLLAELSQLKHSTPPSA